MMVKMSLPKAGHLVNMILEYEKSKGKKFQPHAYETLVTSLEYGVEEEKLYAMVDAYMIPEGIKMPWGTWVKP